MSRLEVKRIYEPASPDDGFRVLVDRVWPRGVSKDRAAIDHWAKALAPSTALRKWFGHDPAKWGEFQNRYRAELQVQAEAVEELVRLRGKRAMTLLYSARDTEHNQAVALRRILVEDFGCT